MKMCEMIQFILQIIFCSIFNIYQWQSHFMVHPYRFRDYLGMFWYATVLVIFAAGLPIWLKPDYDILAIFDHIWLFLEIKTARQNLLFSGFFSVGKAWIWKNIVCAAHSLQISSEKSL